ncbi:MAG: glycosyltransferase family 4 protein [Lachnospiraceae bacterium]|nr:glycosyltransferase family 4 protein [Lachnospiraceae bacterium]
MEQEKRTVVLIGNHHVVIYNFRKELIERLLSENYRVIVLLPYSVEAEKIKALGCEIVDVSVDRRGKNPFRDFKLFSTYRKLLRQIKPNVVLTYTIKPNIYGGLACRSLKIPCFCTVTGIGQGLFNGGFLTEVLFFLYRAATKKARQVFFQNEEDRQLFENRRVAIGKHQLVNGSGVNLEQFSYKEYPKEEPIRLLSLARLARIKGTTELLEAVVRVKKHFPEVEFHLLGFLEDDYKDQLEKMIKEELVCYHGMQEDVIPFLESSHCLIHPSYSEGISNVCLEAAAIGRPIIASDIPGCRECVEDGTTGLLVKMKDADDLAEKIEKFLLLSYNERKHMGELGRKKVEQEFSREKVVDAYLKEIRKIDLREKR